MTIADWITIVAIVLAPILAVQAQKAVERIRERRQRKLRVFHSLMSTRVARVSPTHVEALNMIDLEFYGVRILGIRRQSAPERGVIDAWKVHRDRLNDESNFKDRAGFQRREDAFVDLLSAMSQDLGYDFDKVYLQRAVYSPVAHSDLERDQFLLRKGFLELMDGKRAIPVHVVPQLPESQDSSLATEHKPERADRENMTGQ